MIIRNFHLNSISLKPLINSRLIFTSSRLLDESSSSSDEENDKPKSENSRNEAARKLNELIKLMSKDSASTKLASKVKIPKPREISRQIAFEKKKERELEAERAEKENIGNQLAEAATKVAESLGGDTKKTEAELLEIYFSRRQKPTKPEEKTESSIDKDVPLSEILSGMKIEKVEEISKDSSRAHQVRSVASEDMPKQFKRYSIKPNPGTRINLFGENPLHYFDVEKIKEKNVTPVSLTVWDYLYQRELKLAITHPPKNIFEQLIQWTDDGKIWRFPIDNEQDWIEEQKYDFSDHVFLERWLEPWCPETGPIRYFMELVCIGLSKNPYMTVPEKQAHIFWYEHYFRSKNKLLVETGTGEIKDRPMAESGSA